MVLPAGYEGFTAAKKQEVLWKNCTDTAYDTPEKVKANSSDGSVVAGLQIFVPFYTVRMVLLSPSSPEHRDTVCKECRKQPDLCPRSMRRSWMSRTSC